MNITGIGRLGKDPKMQFTAKNATAQTTMSLAFTTGFGENKDTIWVNAICWGQMAETINKFFSKGDRIAVVIEGQKLRTFTKQDGTEGSTLDGKLIGFEFVDAAKEKSEGKNSSKPSFMEDDVEEYDI